MKQTLKRMMVLLLCAAMLLPLIPAEAAAKAPVSTYEKEPVAAVMEEPEAAVKEEAGQLEKITGPEKEGMWTVYNFETFADLKTLCSKTYTEETQFTYSGNTTLVISENITLPAKVAFSAGAVQISKGATFTLSNYGVYIRTLVVNGVLNCKTDLVVYDELTVNGKINLEGGYIAVWQDTEISGLENIIGGRINYQIWANSESELFAALAEAKANTSGFTYEITFNSTGNVSFSKSFTVPANTTLYFRASNTYTVPSGETMTVNGSVYVQNWEGNSPSLKIAGKLVNNNYVSITVGALEDPVISFTGSGIYSGSGTLNISFSNGASFRWDDVVTGLDPDNLEITEDNYGGYRIRNVADLTKLSTPKNLSWSTTQIGTITWTNGEVTDTSYDYQYYTVKLYRDNVLVDTWNATNKPGNTCSRDLAACWEEDIELKSGTYYFTVQAIPNPNANNFKYKASNIATSPKWTCTRPSKLTTPKNMKTDWPTFSWTGPTNGDFYYYLQIMHAANENDTPRTTCGRWIYSGSSYTLDEQDLKYLRDYFGPGYISIRVRAVSEDITKKAHSNFSALSEDYFFDGYVNEPPTVSISNVASTGKIKLSWNAVMGAAKYEVYRATSKTGTYSKLITVTGTSATNTKADVGKTYYYKVRTVAADGSKSGWSNIVSRTCDLPRPTVTATNVASTGKIKLSWNKIEGATKYQIVRSLDNKNWEHLAYATGTSVTNTKTDAGKTYYYKVRAIHSNSAATSAYSAVVSRVCDLPQVTGLKASNVASTGKIKLSWTKIEGATKYQIVRSLDKTNWEHLAYTTGTSATNTKAEAGKTYYYKVRAVHTNSAATSAYSAVVSRVCDLAQPTLTVTLNSSGKPKLTWTKVEGATKYQIVRSLDKTNWEHLAYTTGTAMTNSSAVAGKTYYYKIRAIHSVSAATSAYSGIKSISVK